MNANSNPPKFPTNPAKNVVNFTTPEQIQEHIDATGEPLAYIEGFAYFYGRQFIVNRDVLIPRPETEDIIRLLLKNQKADSKILDLCTGSGCIGITAKLEIPDSKVTCSDISPPALEVARANASQFNTAVDLVQSDLFQNLPDEYDFILTNPPYVDYEWPWLDHKSLNYEPDLALYADDHGLSFLKQIIEQAPSHLTPNGSLIVECDPSQHPAIISYATEYGLIHISNTDYVIHFTAAN